MIPRKNKLFKITEIEKVIKENIIGQDKIIPNITQQLEVGELGLAVQKKAKRNFSVSRDYRGRKDRTNNHL